jgi:hypothetical protein
LLLLYSYSLRIIFPFLVVTYKSPGKTQRHETHIFSSL